MKFIFKKNCDGFVLKEKPKQCFIIIIDLPIKYQINKIDNSADIKNTVSPQMESYSYQICDTF